MHFTYLTRGVCARKIVVHIEGDTIQNVVFTGGCEGNLKALSAAVKGMSIQRAEELFSGITCGYKNTSCSDQMVQALKAARREMEKKGKKKAAGVQEASA